MKKKVCLIMNAGQEAGMLQMLFLYAHNYELSVHMLTIKKALSLLNEAPDIFLITQQEIASIQLLKKHFAGVPVLVITTEKAGETIVHALAAGATNCIFRGSTPGEYLQACNDIFNDTVSINGAVLKVISGFGKNSRPELLPGGILTKREYDLLQLLKKGFQYKEIANQLGISIETVKRHCYNIYKKLEVGNRTEAVNKLG
jgi:NarL family two-component system response regulator LiaR